MIVLGEAARNRTSICSRVGDRVFFENEICNKLIKIRLEAMVSIAFIRRQFKYVTRCSDALYVECSQDPWATGP